MRGHGAAMRTLFRSLNQVARSRLGLSLIRNAALYPWQIDPADDGSHVKSPLPEEARSYLRADNPRLIDLQRRYRQCDPQVVAEPTIWGENKISDTDLLYFRGDNPYVWQLRGPNLNEFGYLATYYALKSGSGRDLLALFDEDGAFGVHTFQIDDRAVSRDVLDSVREVDFIRSTIGLDGLTVLDIGAGYGRLVHRLSQAAEGRARIFATDAIAASTFISEFYLRFRKADGAEVIPLHAVDALFETVRIDLAVNIHSFSECSLNAVAWWMGRLSSHRVRHVIVIPNQVGAGAAGRCLTNEGHDMEDVFERFGYRRVLSENRFVDPALQKYGVNPCRIFLFEFA